MTGLASNSVNRILAGPEAWRRQTETHVESQHYVKHPLLGLGGDKRLPVKKVVATYSTRLKRIQGEEKKSLDLEIKFGGLARADERRVMVLWLGNYTLL